MKPWEETWWFEATENGESYDVYEVQSSNGRVCETRNQEPEDLANAKLLTAAPEMARMLLALECSGSSHAAETPCCPECRAEWRLGRDFAHDPGCALDALLKKAGVRT